jgi:hypothetical protein
MINTTTKQRSFAGLITLLVMCLSGLAAMGAPLLGTDTFDGGAASGWDVSGPDGTYTVPSTGGNPDGWFKVDYPPISPSGQQLEYIFNNDANHIGNYSNHLVSFSFWVSPVSDPAVALNFYLKANGNLWYNDFIVPSNAWTTVSFDFSGVGWSSLTGTDFLSDVASVTEIGVELNHFNSNGSGFVYGLDNWTTSIPVPEPESMALALVAFISLLLTFRQPILAFVRKRSRA